jgi:hypothetical protein
MLKGDMTNSTTLVIKPSATAGPYFTALQLTAQLKALVHDQQQAATTITSTMVEVAGSHRSTHSSAWVGVVGRSGLGQILLAPFFGIFKFGVDLFSSSHDGHHPLLQHGLVNVTHWPANSKIHLVQCDK